MRHEARCGKLEGKLFPHSPKIGWSVHRTSHVLSHTLDIVCVMAKVSRTLVRIVSGTICATISSSISFFREKYSILFG
jgi:hypothetical protein